MAVELSRGGWAAALAGAVLLHAGLAAGLAPLVKAGPIGKVVTQITFSEPPAADTAPIALPKETSRALRGRADPLAPAETAARLPGAAGTPASRAHPFAAQALPASAPAGAGAPPVPAVAVGPRSGAEALAATSNAQAVQRQAATTAGAIGAAERAGFVPSDTAREASDGAVSAPFSPSPGQAGVQAAQPLAPWRPAGAAPRPAAGRQAAVSTSARFAPLPSRPAQAGRTETDAADAAIREAVMPALAADAAAPFAAARDPSTPLNVLSDAAPVRTAERATRQEVVHAAGSAAAAPGPPAQVAIETSPDSAPAAAAPIRVAGSAAQTQAALLTERAVVTSAPQLRIAAASPADGRLPAALPVARPVPGAAAGVAASAPAAAPGGSVGRLAPLAGGAFRAVGLGASAAVPLPGLSPGSASERVAGQSRADDVALAVPDVPQGDAGGTGRGSAAWRRAVDFVRGFDGGGCFAAMPVEKGAAIGLEAFSADKGAMRRFARNSAEELAAPVDVARGNLAAIQCSALRLAKASRLYPDFTLSIALDGPEDAFDGVTGEIRGAGKRAVHLLVIDEAGAVQTVQRFAADSPDFRFDFPFSRNELAQARGLFLAVASDAPLWNLRFDIAMRSPEFFRLLDQESKANGGALDIAMVAFDLGGDRTFGN